MQAPGKMFLKVTGILLIVFGGLAVVGALLAMAGGGLLAAGAAEAGLEAGLVGGVVMIASIVMLIAGAINLVFGIIGVKNCDKPEKAQSCFVCGIIMIVLQVLGIIMNLSSGSLNIISVLIGLALPVLYTIGAVKNKSVA